VKATLLSEEGARHEVGPGTAAGSVELEPTPRAQLAR